MKKIFKTLLTLLAIPVMAVLGILLALFVLNFVI